MLTQWRRVVRPAGDDSGFTLVELLVSMTIFVILLTIFLAGISSMTTTTVRVTNTGDASTELTRVYTRLDKGVPYATALNLPTSANGSWYVEYLTETVPTGVAPTCTQYRLDTAARQVQVRTWNATGTLALTGWTTLATDVVARAGSPWQVLPADATFERQRLRVGLDLVRPRTPVQQLDTTFVARNTSLESISNADTNNDGSSDNQVCMSQGVGRP